MKLVMLSRLCYIANYVLLKWLRVFLRIGKFGVKIEPILSDTVLQMARYRCDILLKRTVLVMHNDTDGNKPCKTRYTL